MSEQLVAAEPQRNRTVVVGVSLAAAATLMMFAGMIAVYVSIRQNNEHLIEQGLGGSVWFPDLTIQIAPGTMMLFTAMISLFTMAWAVQAIRNDDRRNAYVAMGLTILMGAAIINQVVFAIGDFGLPVDRSTPALLLYALYGAFIVALSVAITGVLLMLLRAIAGQFDSRNSDGIQAAAIYWFAVILVYPAIWYLISITK
jgi:heme/copper-type cytochrome/quinol oxidase subunit 3